MCIKVYIYILSMVGFQMWSAVYLAVVVGTLYYLHSPKDEYPPRVH